MHSHTDLLQLLRVPGMGPVRCRALVDHLARASGLTGASAAELARIPGWDPTFAQSTWEFLRSERAAGERFAEEQIRRAREHGATIISLWDHSYPASLRAIYDPPVLLYVRGTITQGDDLAGC